MIIKLLFKLQKLDRNKYRKRALISGIILITILALDLHRFGAWYMESRTYVKPYWTAGMLIISYPLFKYSLSGLVQYLAAREMFGTIYFIVFYIAALPFCIMNPYVFEIFRKNINWYDTNYFSSGSDFYIGIASIILTPLAYIAVAMAAEYYSDNIGPWLEKKIRGD